MRRVPIHPRFRSAICDGWSRARRYRCWTEAPPDDGLAGAKLAISDNNTTGRFTNQQFELSDAPVRADDDPVAMLTGAGDRGIMLILTDLPADRLLTLADAGRARGVVLFNIEAPDDALARSRIVARNVIHVAPSRSMLADALGNIWCGRSGRAGC